MGNVLTKLDDRDKTWTYEYDDSGRLKTITDPLMRVKSITDKDPAQNVFMQYSYIYDKMDNITSKATWQGVQNYTYDDLYRLTTRIIPWMRMNPSPTILWATV
jgi:YD repeat-containing protein